MVTASTCRHRRANIHSGFTLIEVMVVIALVAILASLAVPSWTQMQARIAVRTVVNDYTHSLFLARSEAVRLNAPVTVCPSNDGVVCTASELEDGWVVHVGFPDGDPAIPNPFILQDVGAKTNVRTGFNVADRSITFLPNGQPGGTPIFSLRVCPLGASLDSLSRNVIVNQTGRTRVAEPGVCEIP